MMIATTNLELLEKLCMQFEEAMNNMEGNSAHHLVFLVSEVRRERLITVYPAPPDETVLEGNLLYMEVKFDGLVIMQDYYVLADTDDIGQVEEHLAHNLIASIFNGGLFNAYKVIMEAHHGNGADRGYVDQ